MEVAAPVHPPRRPFPTAAGPPRRLRRSPAATCSPAGHRDRNVENLCSDVLDSRVLHRSADQEQPLSACAAPAGRRGHRTSRTAFLQSPHVQVLACGGFDARAIAKLGLDRWGSARPQSRERGVRAPLSKASSASSPKSTATGRPLRHGQRSRLQRSAERRLRHQAKPAAVPVSWGDSPSATARWCPPSSTTSPAPAPAEPCSP